ncbi:MAG: hypothetical protein H0X25_04960 [Acidobacteriales bacterium]|nr:hypothetical protein [Terriglobales bacterium]
MNNTHSRSACRKPLERVFLALATLCVFATAIPVLTAQTYKILYTFKGGLAGDGEMPLSGLVLDPQGNLYGTTLGGGTGGDGTIFKLSPAGVETLLHVFDHHLPAEGAEPATGVIRDSQGNLYGTTRSGGDLNCYPPYGCGTVYKLDPAGNFTILHTFSGSDGWLLDDGSSLTSDTEGNLYGAADVGGFFGDPCDPTYGCGVIFKINVDGTENVLHVFTGDDGSSPKSPVVLDPDGNLYGATAFTVFKLDPSGNETVLHRFTGGDDGDNAYGGLIRDAAGNLYGVTEEGGLPSKNCGEAGNQSCGTVFKVTSADDLHVLYQFSGGADGGNPFAGLTFGKSGLYGTTYDGGNLACNRPYGCGTVFQITGKGQKKVLHAFSGHGDGIFP